MTVVLNGSPVSLDGLLGYSKLQDLLALIIGLLNDQGASLTQLRTDSDVSKALVESSLSEVREQCRSQDSTVGSLAGRLEELEKQAARQDASQRLLEKLQERLQGIEDKAKSTDGLAEQLSSLGQQFSALEGRSTSLEAAVAQQSQQQEALAAAQQQQAAEAAVAAKAADAEAAERRLKEIEAGLAELQRRFPGSRAASKSSGAGGGAGGVAGTAGLLSSAAGGLGNTPEDGFEDSLQALQASCLASEQRLAALEAIIGVDASQGATSRTNADGTHGVAAVAAGTDGTSGSGTSAAGGTSGANGANGANGSAAPGAGAAGAHGSAGASKARRGTGLRQGARGPQTGGTGDGAEDDADAYGLAAVEGRLGVLEARVEGLMAQSLAAAGDAGSTGGSGFGGTQGAGSAAGSRRTSAMDNSRRSSREADAGKDSTAQAAPGSRASSKRAAQTAEASQSKHESSEALAASRRLDGKVAELEGLLRADLQELKSTVQGLQENSQVVQGELRGRADKTDEVIRRLEEKLEALQELTEGQLQPGLRSLTEKQATDVLRLTRELKEIQAYLQAMKASGASATARCLSCFSQKFQEQSKIVMGADGKVYKRRPTSPAGGARPGPVPDVFPGDAWAGSPVPGLVSVGPTRSPTAQGPAGPVLRKVRSGQLTTSPAGMAAAEKRKSRAEGQDVPEGFQVEGSMLSSQGNGSVDVSKLDVTAGEILEEVVEAELVA